jgi:threonine-phosphate decarboxylase
VTAKFVGENDSTPAHGGDLVAIGRRYGVDPASLLDFSANVNPAGPPAPLLRALEAGVRDVAALGRYPDPDAASLRYALARTFDIEPEAIIVANGAAALISTALAALRPGRCVVPTPAFSEYRFAIRAAGAQFYALPLDAEVDFALDPQRVCAAVCAHAAEVCVITNPHNPSGSLTAPGILGSLVTAVRGLGTATIVDEAFIDYSPSSSITREAATTPQLVVIRSLTKFFGVPSLRVGYAVAHPDFVRRMRAQLPSWPVTALAIDALTEALADAAYKQRTVAENARARAVLEVELRKLHLHVAPAAANYVLVRLPAASLRAAELVRRLIIDYHIVARDCSTYDGMENGSYIRVAVRSPEDNLRLCAALSATLDRGHACPSRPVPSRNSAVRRK